VYPDEAKSFSASKKSHKPGEENQEESKAATDNKGSIFVSPSQMSPTTVYLDIGRRGDDYGLKKWITGRVRMGQPQTHHFGKVFAGPFLKVVAIRLKKLARF